MPVGSLDSMSLTLQPTENQQSPIALGAVVPFDRWRLVRLIMMAAYLVFFIGWSYQKGMIWQRLAVAAFLGAFLVCAYVGRSAKTWLLLAFDLLFYCAMWYAYETTRGVADDGVYGLKFPVQFDYARAIDRAMFFGHDPNVVLQDRFWKSTVQWWDKVAEFTYFTHFIVPPIVMGALWATNRLQFWRFMRRFSTLLGMACAMFIVLPTAPPWMVLDVKRNTGRGFNALGLKTYANEWKLSTLWGNAVAAMPSLHAGFAMIVPMFFVGWISTRWIRRTVWCVALVFPLTMLTSLVYLGEHWVIDGIVGWALVALSFWFWARQEKRWRDTRADRALDAMNQRTASTP